MFPIIALAALSVAAFAYAAIATLRLIRERAAMSDRIARAVRPVHGAAMRQRPAIVRNRLGED